MLVKGILFFPTVFTPEVAQGASEAKFSAGIIIPPDDPQIAAIQAEVDQAKLNTFPSGYTGQDECFGLYEHKVPPSKSYHDVRFVGWYLMTTTAKDNDRPAVVDMNYTQIIDPSQVYSGMVAYINAGISGYTKGKGGVGGWLNGVMVTDETPPMGRLDGKPTTEQMFSSVTGAPAAHTAANGAVVAHPGVADPTPAPNAAPAPAPAPVAAAPNAPAQLQMTAKANGVTLEQYLATPGWTEEMLIEQGLAIRPSFDVPF